jgi:tetratricopeptide (TPR) repeat protein
MSGYGEHQLATRARRRRRLKYLLWSLPVVVALLYIAFRMMGVSFGNSIALGAYDSGRYESSAERWRSMQDETIIEPYIPWFNRGDASAAQEKYTDAIDDFERALELAPAEQKCTVRVNLALGWEKLGDAYAAGGFFQGAVLLYQAAEAVIAAGPECTPPDQAGEDLQQADKRVKEKIDQAQRQRDAADALEGDDTPGGQQEQLDQLGEKGQAGEQEKATGDAADRGESGSDSGFTDRPW